jgi:hypothetical protein
MAAGEHEAPFEDAHARDAHHVGGGHDHAHDSRDDHGDGQAAGHGGDELGPIDWRAWGAGLLGVGGSMLIAACLYLAVNAA